MAKPSGPVIVDLEADDLGSPLDAPAIETTTLQNTAHVIARRPSHLARWAWRLLIGVIGFWVGLAAWDFVTSLLAQRPVLGYVATGLMGGFILILLLIAFKELRALMRLRRMDALHTRATEAAVNGDVRGAQAVVAEVLRLYSARPDTAWGRDALKKQSAEVLDADGLIGTIEQTVLPPLDAAALAQVETAARQVATVTALVPIALSDVIVALTANLRMIRRIAEIYGGRGGTLGSWRLTRSVFAHLVTTGAVAVGDDLLGSMAGGGVLGKISRRFGEGVVNGALTARVGLAAMEVCRPVPFVATPRPSVSGILKRAVTGLFGAKES